jgi:histidine 2-aminobutanoyltransferase
MKVTQQHYQFLVSISTFESQINLLTRYSVESCECFSLLQDKLDELCTWILKEEQVVNELMGHSSEFDRQLKRLRETAVKALCELERHQSLCARGHQLDISEYLSQLSQNTQIELNSGSIGKESRVLFVGSGSYPLSAFTISQLTGAKVHGVDIDEQAVEMANKLNVSNVVTSFGTQDLVTAFHQFNPTHIVVASLVEHKWELLTELKPHLSRHHKILVRFGNKLKSAFNYPFNPLLIDGWQAAQVKNDMAVYDTVLMEIA